MIFSALSDRSEKENITLNVVVVMSIMILGEIIVVVKIIMILRGSY